MWVWIVGLPAAVALAVGFARWKRDDAFWRPLLAGIVGTATAIAASLAAYLWLFDEQGCSGREDVACLLNRNQGVLALLALVVTAVGLWVVALNRHVDRESLRKTQHEAAMHSLVAALDEAEHNLIHIALKTDMARNQLTGPPQVTISQSQILLSPRFRLHLHPEVIRRAQNLERNYEGIHRATTVPEGAACVAAFTNTSLDLIIAAGMRHAQVAEPVVSRPGYQDLRSAIKKGCYVGFVSGEAARHAARLRGEDTPVICWLNVDPPPGLRILPQCIRFADMNHPEHW